MQLAEIAYEFIYRYSGINKEKIIQAEKSALESISKERLRYENSDEAKEEKPKTFWGYYFKYEKNPLLITGLLFLYSLVNQGVTWGPSDKEPDNDI